jgi:hypothetical protein
MEFQSDNLRARLERSLVTTDSSQAMPPPLDLCWGWYMIGLVRGNRINACSSPEHLACLFHRNNIKLSHVVPLSIAFLLLCLNNRCMSAKFRPQNQTTSPTGKVTISWLCVCASIASLTWHACTFRMAHKVGWQQPMMNVVHEVGSNTGNLNLYNVGVADAKQTCCHSALAVHTSRKGHVFEATSASLHAAAECIWEHLSLIESACTAHHFPLRQRFIYVGRFFLSDVTTHDFPVFVRCGSFGH